MAGLREARASGRVSDGVGVPRRRMYRSCAPHLRGKDSSRSRRQLSRTQRELVRDGPRRAATTLSHLPRRVVNTAEADPRRSLHHDRDRECGYRSRVRESHL